MNKMRKNKKGFTLIEIIVVLVILAVLIAALVPSMIGFISDARGQAMAAEAKTAYTAAQMIGTRSVADGTPITNTAFELKAATGKYALEFWGYMAPDVTKTSANLTSITVNFDNGVVKSLTYIRNGFSILITPGASAVVTKVP